MATSKMKYVGVDGCSAGWFSVGLNDGEGFEVKVFEKFTELVKYYADACLILVDMPIGVPNDGAPSYRPCDDAARYILDKRKPSVFMVPSRRFLDKMKRETIWKHTQANLWSKNHLDGGISQQSFNIVQKTIQVDDIMTSNDVARSATVREIHPEICFWALNCRKEMEHKKDASGRKGTYERLKVLKHLCIEPNVENVYYAALGKYLRKHVDHDDILDALVAAVTAKLGCADPNYELRRLPGENPTDCCKPDPPEMVYAIKKEKADSPC